MLSRDFVYAYLLGQVNSGLTEDQAKSNFSDWISAQDDSFCSAVEKTAALSDLNSYHVKPQEQIAQATAQLIVQASPQISL